MRKRSTVNEDTIFVVKLQKGLADRQRLPLEHVIRVLEEVRQMVTDAGRDIQRSMGMDRPTGEFGLELLAGTDGVLFRKGSVQVQVAVTSNVQTGILAATRIVETIDSLGQKKYVPVDESDRSIIRRLNRIAKIQETDKTEMQFSIKRPGEKTKNAAIFNETARATAFSLQAPVFQMEDITVSGKLCELKVAHPEDDEESGFWGELRRDNGEIWRIQFRMGDADTVTRLFSKQVQIMGSVKYYRISTPKLIAKNITPDTERDYEAAFDELFGCDKKIYPASLDEALKDMRGDE
ncbi:MAG: hypothetical protein ABSA33_03315 [Candidatus Micrarchaeaceae archaeon]|jgi:hypothetical protein